MKYLILIAAVCCFVGIVDLPIAYYTFLRIVVFAASLIIILNEFKSKNLWLIAFLVILILFNPFFPIYLYLKPIWIVIDTIVGLLLLFYFYTLIPKNKIPETEITTIENQETPRTRDRIIK